MSFNYIFGRWKRTLISEAMQEAGRGASYRICVLSLKALGVHPDLARPGATGSNAYCLARRCTTG